MCKMYRSTNWLLDRDDHLGDSWIEYSALRHFVPDHVFGLETAGSSVDSVD